MLDLFERELKAVRFGDLDSTRLLGLADEVREAAEALAAHEARTAELRSALAERQEILLQQAQRALAFARIHAEDDAALTAKLGEISLPRAPKRPKADAPRAPEPSSAPSHAAETAPAESATTEEPAPVEAPAPPARRGKRREAARTVARDDESFDAPAEA
ncbi:MAG TPA: hypothetical protein VFQ35_09180 [Polyangiaceae bacterium]|nr:hypothetical protein [Polyangiaceae bacterium]